MGMHAENAGDFIFSSFILIVSTLFLVPHFGLPQASNWNLLPKWDEQNIIWDSFIY